MPITNIRSKRLRPKESQKSKERQLYIRSKTKSKLTIESRLALKVAKSLEILQHTYIDIHNSSVNIVYTYIEDLKNIEEHQVINFSLDRSFLQKLISQITSYLEQTRKLIIKSMAELIEEFHIKLKEIDGQQVEQEKAKLNELLTEQGFYACEKNNKAKNQGELEERLEVTADFSKDSITSKNIHFQSKTDILRDFNEHDLDVNNLFSDKLLYDTSDITPIFGETIQTSLNLWENILS